MAKSGARAKPLARLLAPALVALVAVILGGAWFYLITALHQPHAWLPAPTHALADLAHDGLAEGTCLLDSTQTHP